MHGQRPTQRSGGFTLVELLVVIAIIAVLIGLLMPAVQKVREAANRTTCQNNLKQLAISSQTYHDANSGFPLALGSPLGGLPSAAINCPSAQVALLPYLEQQNLYQQFVQEAAASGSGWTNALIGNPPPIFACPSDNGIPSPAILQNPFNGNILCGVTSYKPNSDAYASGDLGGVILAALSTAPVTIITITDGTSNTFLIGECSNYEPNWSITSGFTAPFSVVCSNWSSPVIEVAASGSSPLNYTLPADGSGNLFERATAYGSSHSNGANFAFCDGSVHFLSNGVNNTPGLLPALSSRAGGEVIPPDVF